MEEGGRRRRRRRRTRGRIFNVGRLLVPFYTKRARALAHCGRRAGAGSRSTVPAVDVERHRQKSPSIETSESVQGFLCWAAGSFSHRWLASHGLALIPARRGLIPSSVLGPPPDACGATHAERRTYGHSRTNYPVLVRQRRKA